MSINPGGRLAVAEIVGRTKEIVRYWKVLERQSLVLGGERRIGKTHIVIKMHEEPKDGFVTFFQELEKVHGVLELVRTIYATTSSHLSRGKRAKAKIIAAWDALLPTRYKDLKLPTAKSNWKSLLETAVGDVLDAVDPKERVVFLWDELPLMLFNILDREGASTTSELLDLLRHLRQVHGARLRFLFNGSVGLHLVLRRLRTAGNTNAPINDMQKETVPPMCREEAEEVIRRGLVDLDPRPAKSEEPAIVDAIIDGVGGYPYFIQHVVDQLSLLDRPPEVGDVAHAIHELVVADHDPANLRYFVDRIATHYQAQEAVRAKAILDVIAGGQQQLQLVDIANLARHTDDSLTDEDLKETCSLLREDHYLSIRRVGDTAYYDFRWPLLKTWWRGNRL
jgi:uncharacterized protein